MMDLADVSEARAGDLAYGQQKRLEIAAAAERAFLALLDGSCRTPIAAHCAVDGDRIRFKGVIISPDGTEAFEAARDGVPSDAAALGADAAREVRDAAGEKFFTLFAGA